METGYSFEWCNENNLSFRLLNQAREIRAQLKNIKLGAASTPDIEIYQQLKNKSKISRNMFSRVRLALCMGFYMNVGRAVDYGDPGSYLSVNDGSLLHLDSNCVFSMKNTYPTWIIYTSQAGNSLVKGTLKHVSKIKREWIEGLLPNLEKVDLDRLIGKKRQREVTPEIVIPEEPQIDTKIEAAKQRYFDRKYGK